MLSYINPYEVEFSYIYTLFEVQSLAGVDTKTFADVGDLRKVVKRQQFRTSFPQFVCLYRVSPTFPTPLSYFVSSVASFIT